MKNQGVNLETNLPNHHFSNRVASRFALGTYSANPIMVLKFTMFCHVDKQASILDL